jgi:hypothetical protein
MRARYYHPLLGRFLSEDPIGLAAGPNVYAYAEGNPIMVNDPSGLEPIAHDVRRLDQYIEPSDVGSAFQAGLNIFNAGGIPALTEHFSEAPRYTYNSKTGWIDMQHVAAAARMSNKSFAPTGQILGLAIEMSQLVNAFNPFRSPQQRAEQRESAFSPEDFRSNAIGDVASIMQRFPEGQALVPSSVARALLDRPAERGAGALPPVQFGNLSIGELRGTSNLLRALK